MFDAVEMRALREDISRYAVGFDPALLDGDAAASVLDDAAAAVNMLEAVKGLAATRVAETHAYRQRGQRSAAHQMAFASGTTVGLARMQLRAAEQLADLPLADKAYRQGKLSPQKAAAIADAATADPDAEERLVGIGERRSLGETKEECARTKAAADRDAESRHKRIKAERSYRLRNCGDGSGEFTCHGPIEAITAFVSVVAGFARTEFDKARIQGRRETPEA